MTSHDAPPFDHPVARAAIAPLAAAVGAVALTAVHMFDRFYYVSAHAMPFAARWAACAHAGVAAAAVVYLAGRAPSRARALARVALSAALFALVGVLVAAPMLESALASDPPRAARMLLHPLASAEAWRDALRWIARSLAWRGGALVAALVPLALLAWRARHPWRGAPRATPRVLVLAGLWLGAAGTFAGAQVLRSEWAPAAWLALASGGACVLAALALRARTARWVARARAGAVPGFAVCDGGSELAARAASAASGAATTTPPLTPDTLPVPDDVLVCHAGAVREAAYRGAHPGARALAVVGSPHARGWALRGALALALLGVGAGVAAARAPRAAPACVRALDPQGTDRERPAPYTRLAVPGASLWAVLAPGELEPRVVGVDLASGARLEREALFAHAAARRLPPAQLAALAVACDYPLVVGRAAGRFVPGSEAGARIESGMLRFTARRRGEPEAGTPERPVEVTIDLIAESVVERELPSRDEG